MLSLPSELCEKLGNRAHSRIPTQPFTESLKLKSRDPLCSQAAWMIPVHAKASKCCYGACKTTVVGPSWVRSTAGATIERLTSGVPGDGAGRGWPLNCLQKCLCSHEGNRRECISGKGRLQVLET